MSVEGNFVEEYSVGSIDSLDESSPNPVNDPTDEWGLVGVSADILTDGMADNKQTIDNIILCKEDSSFLLPENVLSQEFTSRREITSYQQVQTHLLDEESRRIIIEEFNRSYITISVLSNQADVFESVFEGRDIQDSPTNCIFHYYHPNYPSWSSTLKSSMTNYRSLISYINGEYVNDRCILVKLHQLFLRLPPFEPLFAKICLYCYNDVNFVRITESHHFDLTPSELRMKYHFLYDSRLGNMDNSPCVFSIPSDINVENLFMIVVVSKVLTSGPDISTLPYTKSGGSKIDETKHSDAVKRLCDYRQHIAFGAIRLLDDQGRCGHHGGPNITIPLFSYKHAMSDYQLGSIVRDLFPLHHGSLVPTAATIQKSKQELLDMELVFNFSDVGVNIKTANDSNRPYKQPNRLFDTEVVNSFDYYSSLSHDIPRMMDNPMSRELQDPIGKLTRKESIKVFNIPIIRLKTIIPPEIPVSMKDVVRHMYTSEENMMYLYPLFLENFHQRNLCIQIEFVEFTSNPSSLLSLSVGEHHPIPCIVNQSITPSLTTQAYTTVFYHNKSPYLHDEIKIRLPERLTNCHFIKFTVLHIHVKPKYVNNGNFFTGMLSSVPKEMDSSFIVIGVAYIPILTTNQDGSYYLIPDSEYTLQVTETLTGPVSESDVSERNRRSTHNILPSIKFATKTFSSYYSSCKVIFNVLKHFPQSPGFYPSMSHERYGDSFAAFTATPEQLMRKSIDATVKFDPIIKQINIELLTVANTRELQRFFLLVFRYLNRVMGYKLLLQSNLNSPESIDDIKNDSIKSADNSIEIRTTGFLSLIKLMNVISEPRSDHDYSSTGGEATLKAYVELLLDEEENLTTYRAPMTKDTVQDRIRSFSFTDDSPVVGSGKVESPIQSKPITGSINQILEFFVQQCERFIFESVIQEIVNNLDIFSLFNEICGNSDNDEFALPHKCIRWWSEYLSYRDHDSSIPATQAPVEKMVNAVLPFDFENGWFEYMERLHKKSSPNIEMNRSDRQESEGLEDRNSDNNLNPNRSKEEKNSLPCITSVPSMPRYDRLDRSLLENSPRLWLFHQITIHWLSLLLAIRILAEDINQVERIQLYSSVGKSVALTAQYYLTILYMDQSKGNTIKRNSILPSNSSSKTKVGFRLNARDAKIDLANNSPILFRMIWKSLCIRIIRQNLRTPVVLTDDYMNILLQLLIYIKDELSDESGLGIHHCRRLSSALSSFMTSLILIVCPNQFKILLSTCLLVFNNCITSDYLDLKLQFISTLSDIDVFVALNAPYVHDTPFSKLLVSGSLEEHHIKSNLYKAVDKYSSVGNYRYESAIGPTTRKTSRTSSPRPSRSNSIRLEFPVTSDVLNANGVDLSNQETVHVDDVDYDHILLPSWFASSLIQELIKLTRVGDRNITKRSLSILRNLILRPFHDFRYVIQSADVLSSSNLTSQNYSRIASLYVPLLLNFIGNSEKLSGQPYDSTIRKEVLVLIIGLLQGFSEKVLRGLLKHICSIDQYAFTYRMPISVPSSENPNIYRPGGLSTSNHIGNRCKMQSLIHILHLVLDTFERPGVYNPLDSVCLNDALSLLAPDARVNGLSARFTPQHQPSGSMNMFSEPASNVIVAQTSRSASSLEPLQDNTARGQISQRSEAVTEPITPLEDGQVSRSKTIGTPMSNAATIDGKRGETHSRDLESAYGVKSEKLFGYRNFITSATPAAMSPGLVERKRLAEVVKNEFMPSNNVIDISPRLTVKQQSMRRTNEFLAMDCALSVATMASSTTLRVIQAMLEEIPQLYHNNSLEYTAGSDDDSLLHFVSSVLLLMLHLLYSSPALDVTWKTFQSAGWIIQHLGFHLFYYATGDSLQDWIWKSISICYDLTSNVDTNSSLRAYTSPQSSPEMRRIPSMSIDSSSYFLSLLLYSCFKYTGSIVKLKYIFLSLSQEFITTTINEDQGGKKKIVSTTKRNQSSIDLLRERFHTMFKKILQSCSLISWYYFQSNSQTNSSMQSFLSSIDNLLSKIKILVKAYTYIVRQIGVDRVIRYSYQGENTLDGTADSMPRTEMDANDMMEIPKVVSPLKVDYHYTIELLMKAALVFDPLYLPRFHLFWLENMALIHDIYGNTAESAITRLRIYDVCKDVADGWDSLWVPHKPIIWTSRISSISSSNENGKRISDETTYSSNSRDFHRLFIDNLKSPRPQPWKDWYQYRQHLRTVLMKTLSILSAASVIRWEQKVSMELVNFYQLYGETTKVAEEYTRLGNSINRATTRGLDKFSMGNFYRVHYSGYAIPEHLRDKTFIYRDAKNSHISEFQSQIKDSLMRLLDKGIEITMGSDNQEQLSSSNHAAMIILGSVRPEHDIGQMEVHITHLVNTFQYEIPFTLSGKSHSQRIDEQYKRKIVLRVEVPFPCTFVRQEVIQKIVQVLNPIEVAIDDVRERVNQMNKFLAMRSVRDPTVLREMMRVLQGSIMPQVHAGVVEVAKAFLGQGVRIRMSMSYNDDNNQSSVPDGISSDEIQEPGFDTKQLKVILIQFLDSSRRLLRRVGDNIRKINIEATQASDRSVTPSQDLNNQWLDEMKKAYRLLYDRIDPLINDVYDRGVLQRTVSASTIV